MVGSLFVSSLMGSTRHWPSTVLQTCKYLTIFVCYDIFVNADRNTLKYTAKVVLGMACLICFAGLIEFIAQDSLPYKFLVELGVFNEDTMTVITENRYGFKRMQSLFDMHTSLGGYSCIVFPVLYYVKRYGILNSKILLNSIICLLLIFGFLTGSRACIIGIVVCAMIFMDFSSMNAKKIMFIVLGVVIILPLLIPYFETIYDSFVNTDTVGGSNSDMREGQLEISVYYMLQSPWYGNGLAFSGDYVIENFQQYALGLESRWFPLMIDQGLIGCASLIVIYIAVIRFVWKKHNKVYLFPIIGYLIANTLSSLPHTNEVILINHVIYACAIYAYAITRKKQRAIK